jgi:uncharacterized membrane-anchored protein YitT (DUF2179 family)
VGKSIGLDKEVPIHRHKKLTTIQFLRRGLFLTIGAALASVGLEIFLVPNRIVDGGLVGISIMSWYLSQVPIGIYLILFNLPFLLIGYKQIGKTFAVSTLYAVIILAIGTTLLHPVKPITIDPLLAAVFGGIIIGIGFGMVIRSGGSLDGIEIVAILFSKRLLFSVGEIVMFINLFILVSAGFVFGWDRAMYSLIAYFIAFKLMDVTIEGFDESKAIWIISEHSTLIGDTILHRLGRGVTYLKGTGAYTGGEKKVIFCVITRLEEAKLKSIVDELDPDAFLAIGNIHDVKGGRFKKNNIH